MSSPRQIINIQKWITLLGLLLMCIKFVAYFITQSVAIFTDAVESIANVIAGCIGWYSLYIASKPRDNNHPYGHGKAEFLSAAIEGTLITLAGVFIIIEAAENLFYPHIVRELDNGIILIAITGCINFIIGRFAIRIGTKSQSIAIIATGKHLRSDAYSTAGLIAGLLVLRFTEVWWLDSIIATIVACIVMYTGYKIIRKSIAGMMDEADIELLDRMVQVLEKNRYENWVDLHNLRVIKYGSRLHVDCHLTLPWFFNVHEAHSEVEHLSSLIKMHFGDTLEIFVHTDGCLPFSCRVCDKKHCTARVHTFEQQIKWNRENIFLDQKHSIRK